MKHPLRHQQYGLSLIELMISITLGLIILASLIAVFGQNSNSFRQNDAVAEMQDNARFAMEALTRDLSMAGFNGGIFDASDIVTNPNLTLTTDCGVARAVNGNTVPWFQLATNRVEFQDNATISSTFTCLGQAALGSELQPNSDIVATRRAAGQASAPPMLSSDTSIKLHSTTFYLQTNGTQGSLIQTKTFSGSNGNGSYTPGTSSPNDVPQNPPMSFYVWKPRVYFIRPYSHNVNESPQVPALCRMELQNSAAPTMQVECLADGVQTLQIEWGIDNDGDCVPDQYIANPMDLLSKAVTARIWLLMRTSKIEAGYTDSKTYSTTGFTFTPAVNDHYRRRVYTTTVQLRNPNNTQGLCVQAPAPPAPGP